MTTFHPTYFYAIAQFALMLRNGKFTFEVHDNFQKQTYRNRCYVYGANGKQLLNVPVQKISGKQLYRNVKIDYRSNWQSEHLKTLYSAYNSSPFFEYYIDDLNELFSKKETYLIDLNINIFKKITKLLQEQINFNKTTDYNLKIQKDYRYLVNAKAKETFKLDKYTQVFDNKHGFISNLSILDLLFNEGPAANIYLSKILKTLDKKDTVNI